MSIPHYTGQLRRSNGIGFTILVAFLCMLALASCNAPQVPQSGSTANSPAVLTDDYAQSDTTPLRSPFVLSSASAAAASASVSDFDELLARYPEVKRERIKAWYEKHAGGSMTFKSNAQWQWIRQHDYPTPADVSLASAMSPTQLRDLAHRGDTKANFFYLARLLDDAAQAGDSEGSTSRGQTHLQAELAASMDRALASGSAFAGYMFGNYYAALQGNDVAGTGRAAGLIWALSLGDTRAEFTRQLSMGFPGVSGVRVAEVYFDMFAAAARVNPNFLNVKRGQGDLFIPLQ